MNGRFALPLLLILSGCNSEIYVRNGVTDGDRFTLAPQATEDRDPVLQSWVAYSLAKSICQLDAGDANPARHSSFHCESRARAALARSWAENQGAQAEDPYLDALAAVRAAGLVREYTAHYFAERHWSLPADLDTGAFDIWRHRHLTGHRPETRIIGSWSYQPGTELTAR